MKNCTILYLADVHANSKETQTTTNMQVYHTANASALYFRECDRLAYCRIEIIPSPILYIVEIAL